MADDLARLGVVVTPQGITVTTQQLEKLTTAAKAAAKGTDETAAGATKMGKSLSGLSAQAQATASNLLSIKSLIVGLGTAAAAKEVVDLADAWTLVNARLKLVSGSATEAAATQDKLFRMAQQNSASFTSLADIYTKVARNSAQLGASSQQVLKFVDVLSKGIQVSGATAAEASAGLLQLSQSMASGEVRGDEFRSVMENLSFVAQEVAKNLGLTMGQLRDLSQNGGLTAQKFFAALLGQSKEVDEMFKKIPITVGMATTQLSNAWGKYVTEVNQATGTTGSLASALIDLKNSLSDPALVSAGTALVNNVAALVRGAAEAAPAITRLGGALLGAFSAAIETYNQLPETVQTYGLLMALIFGRAGLGVFAAVLAAIEYVDRGLNAMGETLARVKKKQEGEGLFDSLGDDIETFKRRWDANGSAFGKLAEALGLVDVKLQSVMSKKDVTSYFASAASANEAAILKTLGISDKLSLTLKNQAQWTKKDAEEWDKLVAKLDPAADAMKDLNEWTNLLIKAQQMHKVSSEDANRMLTRAIDLTVQRSTKEDANTKKVREAMEALRDKVRVAKEEATEGKRAAERLQLESQLRDQLDGDYESNKEKILELIAEYEHWQTVLGRQKQVEEQAQAQADAWGEIWKNAASGIQQTFVDMFAGIFDEGFNVGKALANVFKQMFAQVMTQAIFGNLIQGIAGIGNGAAAGGGGGGSMLGAGAMGGLFGGLASGSAVGGGLSGFVMMNPAFSAVAGAGIGVLGGGMLSKALGLSKTGGQIGGGIGGLGATAAILAGVNPLLAIGGMVLSSILGGLIGSLFGGKPSDKTAGYSTDVFGNSPLVNLGWPEGSPKYSQENDQQAKQFVTDVQRLVSEIQKTTGARFDLAGGPGFAVKVGDRDGIRALFGGQDLRTFADPKDLTRAIVEWVVAGVRDVGPIVDKALKTIDFVTDPDKGAALLQYAVEVQKFLESATPKSDVKQQLEAIDAQANTLRTNLEAIGQGADLLDTVLAKLKKSVIDEFVGGLDTTLNSLRGQGFLNDMKQLIDTITGLRASAVDAGQGMAQVNEIFTLSIQSIVDGIIKSAKDASTAGANLNVLRAAFANVPEVLAAIDGVISHLADYFTPTAPDNLLAALKASQDLQKQIIGDQLDALKTQQQLAQARLNSATGTISSIDDALYQLGTNAQYGSSPSQRYAAAQQQYNQTLARALVGDVQAQQSLAKIGLDFLQISREFNATSEAFFADRDRVADGLGQVRGIAASELAVAQATLNSIQSQTDVLIQIRDAISNGRPTGNAGTGRYTRADFNALNEAYVNARGSMSDAEFLAGPQGSTWVGLRDAVTAGQTDISVLMDSLAVAQQQSGTSGLQGVGSSWIAGITARLHELHAPGFDQGGSTPLTFRAHADETIVMGNRAQVVSAAQAKAAVAAATERNDNLGATFKGGARAIVMSVEKVAQAQADMAAEMAELRRAMRLMTERMGK